MTAAAVIKRIRVIPLRWRILMTIQGGVALFLFSTAKANADFNRHSKKKEMHDNWKAAYAPSAAAVAALKVDAAVASAPASTDASAASASV